MSFTYSFLHFLTRKEKCHDIYGYGINEQSQGEILRLVASVNPSICPFVCMSRLTMIYLCKTARTTQCGIGNKHLSLGYSNPRTFTGLPGSRPNVDQYRSNLCNWSVFRSTGRVMNPGSPAFCLVPVYLSIDRPSPHYISGDMGKWVLYIKYGLCYAKRSLIYNIDPESLSYQKKDRSAWPRPSFCWYDTDVLDYFFWKKILLFFFKFLWFFFFLKTRCHRARPSFGITTTQAIKDLFAWRQPYGRTNALYQIWPTCFQINSIYVPKQTCLFFEDRFQIVNIEPDSRQSPILQNRVWGQNDIAV